jgi:hypothetical protein
MRVRVAVNLPDEYNGTITCLSEYLTFMSYGDREAAIWSVAEACHTTVDAIETSELNSYVIVSATKIVPAISRSTVASFTSTIRTGLTPSQPVQGG